MLDSHSGAALVAPASFQESNRMKTITVKATRAFFYEGKLVKAGTVATYERAFAAELISNQKAEPHTAAAPKGDEGKVPDKK